MAVIYMFLVTIYMSLKFIHSFYCFSVLVCFAEELIVFFNVFLHSTCKVYVERSMSHSIQHLFVETTRHMSSNQVKWKLRGGTFFQSRGVHHCGPKPLTIITSKHWLKRNGRNITLCQYKHIYRNIISFLMYVIMITWEKTISHSSYSSLWYYSL